MLADKVRVRRDEKERKRDLQQMILFNLFAYQLGKHVPFTRIKTEPLEITTPKTRFQNMKDDFEIIR